MSYSKLQSTALVGLRLLIGWHFLYEGIVKLLNPNWSAIGYLSAAGGPFGWLFNMMGSAAGIVDFLTIWLMIAIGLMAILGFWVRPAAIAGMVLLGLFYLAYPPFPGIETSMPTEGSYIIVNKNLIELFALMTVMAFPTSGVFGIERLFMKPATAPVTN